MHLLCCPTMRGGVSHISPRHSSTSHHNHFFSLSSRQTILAIIFHSLTTPCLCTRPALFVSSDRGCLDVFLPSLPLITPHGNRLRRGLSSEVNLLSVGD
ncbi:hypothetical protein CDAR_620331 [Caerostris darwini]|uniref:Uncharacterized protein n=1 Tax=Caerostris darwini TaxID=1538125 RepID=A0AAV4VLN2_9ARAC|nr:hypothetical protein CDAR_620331 [Caerostris darwini]